MEDKHLIWIIPASMIVGIILFFSIVWSVIPEENSKLISDEEIVSYWACMDGCFFMEEIILVQVSPENKTQQGFHSNCSSVCWNEWVVGEKKFKEQEGLK